MGRSIVALSHSTELRRHINCMEYIRNYSKLTRPETALRSLGVSDLKAVNIRRQRAQLNWESDPSEIVLELWMVVRGEYKDLSI